MTDLIGCPSCQLQMDNVPELAGQVVACPQCGQQFVMPATAEPVPPPVAQSMPAFVPSASPHSRAIQRPPSGDIVSSYISACGIRSIIFQALLLGWTVLIGLLGFYMCVATMPSEMEREWADAGIAQGQGAVLAWGIWGLACPLCTWIGVGLPLLIAAIATLKSGR